jgi:D-inositol-3-phosphate glycosyltransferase
VESRTPSPVPTPARVGLLSVHTSPLAQPGTGDAGGMNVYVAALADQLVMHDVDVDVFTRATGGDLPPTVVTPSGVRVHHVPAGPPALGKSDLASHLCAFYLAMAAHPATAGLDVLHAHYWMSGWVGRRARDRLGLPLVQTFHTLGRVKNADLSPGDVPETPLRIAAEERIVADADAIISPTPAEHTLLRERYGARPGSVHVVEPGVDVRVFSPDGDRLAERQALGGGRIILFVGRLQPLKGPDLAVRTLAALVRRLDGRDDGQTRLVIVGGASGNGAGSVDPPALRRLAEELGVGDRVALLAPRRQAELAGLYRAADAVIVPSYSESFGLVALEAQACGTPVVAADVSGLRHVLRGGGGTLVAGHDPEAFAGALLPYLREQSVREQAGATGRRRAAAQTWELMAERTLQVYAQVMADGLQSVACGQQGA